MRKIVLCLCLLAVSFPSGPASPADFSAFRGKHRIVQVEGGCRNSGSTFFFDGDEAIVSVRATCDGHSVSGKLDDATGRDDGSIWLDGNLAVDGKSVPCGVVIGADKSASIDFDGKVYEFGRLVK